MVLEDINVDFVNVSYFDEKTFDISLNYKTNAHNTLNVKFDVIGDLPKDIFVSKPTLKFTIIIWVIIDFNTTSNFYPRILDESQINGSWFWTIQRANRNFIRLQYMQQQTEGFSFFNCHAKVELGWDLSTEKSNFKLVNNTLVKMKCIY